MVGFKLRFFNSRIAARRTVASVLAIGAVFAVLPQHVEAATAPTLKWSRSNIAGTIRESSPNVGIINGKQAVTIGHLNGNVYALDANNGGDIAGWPRQLGAPVDSSQTIGDIDGDGKNEVFTGSGSWDGTEGSNWGLNGDGSTRWTYRTVDNVDASHAIISTPALGDVNGDGAADVSGFTLGLHGWSFDATNGATNPGWPVIQDDSIFSSPALTDIDGDGQTDYVVGGDSWPGAAVDHQGGIVRAFRGDGSVIWDFRPNEAIRSSPVVGDINGDGQPEIVFGGGDYWDRHGGASDSTKVFVLNRRGQLLWSRDLGAHTMAAPALADVDGNGTYDIIEGTWDGAAASRGRITVLDGNGNALPNWNKHVTGGDDQLGQVSTADFNNDGKQDILSASSLRAVAWDGATGNELFRFDNQVSFQNAPWIGDIDGNGKLDIVLAGTNVGQSRASIERYEMPNTTANLGARGWSQFRHDARHTGSLTNPPLVTNRCLDHPGVGYYMVAADGGMFSYCLPFHGSMGGKPLNKPIVGMAAVPGNVGYWQVATDGGIFTFGNIGYYGSMGGKPLNQPIVGMAAMPNGKGYWEVASDGGIFTFGDAQFFGSMGGKPLNKPIVAMTTTPSGKGYWMVASDGGIFSFGDAQFFGSMGGRPLNKPIVAMTTTPSGKGYWMVASDGGIFAFGDAGFYDSMGGKPLNQPIVGMDRSEGGHGYRLFARDGGVFCFGDAAFVGSAGNLRLNKPIVGGS